MEIIRSNITITILNHTFKCLNSDNRLIYFFRVYEIIVCRPYLEHEFQGSKNSLAGFNNQLCYLFNIYFLSNFKHLKV